MHQRSISQARLLLAVQLAPIHPVRRLAVQGSLQALGHVQFPDACHRRWVNLQRRADRVVGPLRAGLAPIRLQEDARMRLHAGRSVTLADQRPEHGALLFG
jgi:hypothetical protein